MKKTFVVALATTAALVLGACGKSTDTTSEPITDPYMEDNASSSETQKSDTQWRGIIEDGVFVIENCITSEKNIVVPDTISGHPVGKLADNAFYGLSCTSIVLPDTVTDIGDNAFLECLEIEHIELGKGVQTIGGFAFSDCPKLKSITFPDGMKTIENPLFVNNSALEEVYIPASVVNLPERIASNKTCPNIVIVTPEGSEAEKIALAQGLTVRHPKGETAVTPSTDTVDLICERIGCTKQQAESIASRLSKLELPAITSIEKSSADDNSITVTTDDGKEYEVGVDKLYRVYSVRDMETDKYLFTITE